MVINQSSSILTEFEQPTYKYLYVKCQFDWYNPLQNKISPQIKDDFFNGLFGHMPTEKSGRHTRLLTETMSSIYVLPLKVMRRGKKLKISCMEELFYFYQVIE